MKILVPQLDFAVPAASGPDYSAEIQRIFPEIPERWVFFGSAASLESNKGGFLIPGSGSPAFSSAGVTTPNGSGGGLLTPYNDSANFSEVVVLRRVVAGSLVAGGTLTANAADGGDALFLINSGGNTIVRSIGRGMGTGEINIGVVPNTTFVVIGQSVSDTSSILATRGYSAATRVSEKAVRAGAKRFVGHNDYSGGSFTSGATFAEYTYWPRPLSAAELLEQINAAAIRVAARGFQVN